MKMKKIFAGMTASAMAMGLMAVSASAMTFDNEMSAGISMQFNTDTSTVAEWEDTAATITAFEFGTPFDITLDLGADGVGQPANYFAIETGLKGNNQEEFVNAETGENTLKYSVTVNSITCDGEAYNDYNADGLDVHVEDGKYRAEFFKDPGWGGTATAIDTFNFPEFSKLVINVTIDQVDGSGASEGGESTGEESEAASETESEAASEAESEADSTAEGGDQTASTEDSKTESTGDASSAADTTSSAADSSASTTGSTTAASNNNSGSTTTASTGGSTTASNGTAAASTNSTANPAASSDNQGTGAAAGIALAGIAVAGAALVITRKKL